MQEVENLVSPGDYPTSGNGVSRSGTVLRVERAFTVKIIDDESGKAYRVPMDYVQGVEMIGDDNVTEDADDVITRDTKHTTSASAGFSSSASTSNTFGSNVNAATPFGFGSSAQTSATSNPLFALLVPPHSPFKSSKPNEKKE